MSPHSTTVSASEFDSEDLGSNPNVAAILDDLAALGWLFNNCYQHDDGSWRVNLRRLDPNGDWFTDWATGPTFASALEDCMSKLHDAEFEPTPATNGIIDKSKPKSFLDAIGLQTKTNVERRI